MANRHEQFFFTARTHDISWERSVSATGKLINDLRNFASDRWKLRNCDLSTGVDKEVSNSNLNHDFRSLASADKVQRKGVKE